MPASNKRKGFTLVELPVVLVIIGLLVGGVMVGKDLIHSAEIRKGISSLEKVAIAVNAFKLKYNCIPGDCPNAYSFLGTSNGDGNGRIDNWPNESQYAWDALLASNFISKTMMSNGDDINGNFYLTGYNNSYSYLYFADLYSDRTWAWGNPNRLPNATKPGVTVTWAGNDHMGNVDLPSITSNDTFRMDEKIDDGMPSTGRFLADGNTGKCTTGSAYQRLDVIGCRMIYYLPGN